jgi:hypothetical protein
MNDVPIARDVVGCKVDPHGFATIDPFVQYVYGLPIFFSKFAIAVALIVSIKKPSEQVIFEFGDKILLAIWSDVTSDFLRKCEDIHQTRDHHGLRECRNIC